MQPLTKVNFRFVHVFVYWDREPLSARLSRSVWDYSGFAVWRRARLHRVVAARFVRSLRATARHAYYRYRRGGDDIGAGALLVPAAAASRRRLMRGQATKAVRPSRHARLKGGVG